MPNQRRPLPSGQSALFLFTLCIVLSALAPPLHAQCLIEGTSEAHLVHHPLGDWKYTVHLSWETDFPHNVSHFTVDLALGSCFCCEDLDIAFADTTGLSSGTNEVTGEACDVFYQGEMSCTGDPTIIGFDGPTVKFEPLPDPCEPGRTGGGTYWFYSDWPPVYITDGLLALKAGHHLYCVGGFVGMMPECTCSPVPTRGATWGRIKQIHR